MNANEIPTPEMDGLEINVPDTRVNAIMALNAVIGKGKDLERRLTVARESLKKLDNWLMRDAQRKQIIEQTLTLTAPTLMNIHRYKYEHPKGYPLRVRSDEVYGWAAVKTETGEVNLESFQQFDDELCKLADGWEWKKFALTLSDSTDPTD